jgi:hypothetical protein
MCLIYTRLLLHLPKLHVEGTVLSQLGWICHTNILCMYNIFATPMQETWLDQFLLHDLLRVSIHGEEYRRQSNVSWPQYVCLSWTRNNQIHCISRALNTVCPQLATSLVKLQRPVLSSMISPIGIFFRWTRQCRFCCILWVFTFSDTHQKFIQVHRKQKLN